jgi:hypothetical protein
MGARDGIQARTLYNIEYIAKFNTVYCTNLCVSKLACNWTRRQYYCVAPAILFPDTVIPYGTLSFGVLGSVADPDPEDPYVFGLPGSGSISMRYHFGSSRENSKKTLDSYCFVASL